MKLTTEINDYTFSFELEKDTEYVLHDKYDALNTKTAKMFKKGEIVAYNLNVLVSSNQTLHDPLFFYESGFLFSPNDEKSHEDLREFLEDSPFIEDILEKINLYKKIGSL